MPSHQVPAVDRRECPTLQIHVYFPSKVPFLSTQKKSLAVPLILRRSMLLQTGSGPLHIRAPAYMHASEKKLLQRCRGSVSHSYCRSRGATIGDSAVDVRNYRIHRGAPETGACTIGVAVACGCTGLPSQINGKREGCEMRRSKLRVSLRPCCCGAAVYMYSQLK